MPGSSLRSHDQLLIDGLVALPRNVDLRSGVAALKQPPWPLAVLRRTRATPRSYTWSGLVWSPLCSRLCCPSLCLGLPATPFHAPLEANHLQVKLVLSAPRPSSGTSPAQLFHDTSPPLSLPPPPSLLAWISCHVLRTTNRRRRCDNQSRCPQLW